MGILGADVGILLVFSAVPERLTYQFTLRILAALIVFAGALQLAQPTTLLEMALAVACVLPLYIYIPSVPRSARHWAIVLLASGPVLAGGVLSITLTPIGKVLAILNPTITIDVLTCLIIWAYMSIVVGGLLASAVVQAQIAVQQMESYSLD